MSNTKHTPGKGLLHGHSMEWRVNLPQFLKEVFDHYPSEQGGIFISPVRILQGLLIELTERASEINDPVLNALMCRLSLYAEADPYDKINYNHEILSKTLNNPEYLKWSNIRKKRQRKAKEAIKKATK